MFHNEDQQTLRQMYFSAWEKHQQKKPLTALEQQIVAVMLEHPEYQAIANHHEKYLEKTYHASDGETNPFLHMGLHLGLREQLATNRPAGIVDIYQRLCETRSEHDAQHVMMSCLAETLFQAQRHNQLPDEDEYLKLLKNIN
ncbi:MAG: hypothetical protein CMF39_01385 [Legionellaceae bacterium]|nr:hypothetical protein [Legionellaceae bacterium]